MRATAARTGQPASYASTYENVWLADRGSRDDGGPSTPLGVKAKKKQGQDQNQNQGQNQGQQPHPSGAWIGWWNGSTVHRRVIQRESFSVSFSQSLGPKHKTGDAHAPLRTSSSLTIPSPLSRGTQGRRIKVNATSDDTRLRYRKTLTLARSTTSSPRPLSTALSMKRPKPLT